MYCIVPKNTKKLQKARTTSDAWAKNVVILYLGHKVCDDLIDHRHK